MRFSILVPVYNAAAYIGACIDSVLNQTCADFELVLIDDGSTDDGPRLLDEAAAAHPERVRVFHQQNLGLIAARRAGIARARGAVCVFLDADDALAPEALATIGETMDESGADMVIYNYWNVYGDKAVSADPVYADGTVFAGRDKMTLYAELIRGWKLNNLCTKAIATDLVQADDTPYEAYFGNPHTEDLLQTLYPITHAKTVVYRALPLYRYRRTASSMSAVALKGRIEAQCNEPVMALLRQYMTRWGMDEPKWLRVYHTRRLFNLISLFFQHYRAAQNGAERRAVLANNWAGQLTGEDRQYLRDNGLDRAKRLQLWGILRRCKPLLDLFLLVGNARMRGKYGA